MCRWNAYFGQPVMVDELLFKTQHGLIDQRIVALAIQPGANEQRPFQPQRP